MTNHLPAAIVVLATTFFIAMWCASSLFLGWLSGWFDLQQWYCDDGNEEPLLKLRWVSASMGNFGLYLKHCVILAAKPSGFSVRMFRLFAPFQKPLLIPWHDIRVEEASTLGLAKVRLLFGNPSVGQLRINQWTWSRLVDVLPQSVDTAHLKSPAPSSVNDGSIVQNLFIQWLLMIAATSIALIVIAHASFGQHFPLQFMIIWFSVCFGIAQVARYVRLT